MFWLVARQPNIILHEYTNVQWHPLTVYIQVYICYNFISVGMRQVSKGISNFKWLLGSHFVFFGAILSDKHQKLRMSCGKFEFSIP